ncbi:hypothetical protein J5J83_22860 [Azoarcus sp. L1K30]|uniref:lipocalin family protein n=1 Tax=Azoarcus sp. L1K30 TaxID=2820277 RepID=UPI001B8351E2|nr:lipocalin family protein [Azoarcus sp. L1K30]MBR0568978.1 hypothetical protein [Azoarcus sp. L1K30]
MATDSRRKVRYKPQRRRWKRYIGPVLATLAVVLAVGAYVVLLGGGGDGNSRARAAEAVSRVVERTSALRPVRLPEDSRPHARATEWWYYNGQLAGAGGERFAFHVSVFLRDGLVRHTVFHVSLTDLRTGKRYERQLRTGGVPTDPTVDGFDFKYEGLRVRGLGADHTVSIADKDFTLALDLTDAREPVLHTAKGSMTPGRLDFGEAGMSYYYSRPRLAASGTVALAGGKAVAVKGAVWFDHQWGDFEASRLAWNWFALQLDDGSELMVYELFDADGKLAGLHGTRSSPGKVRALGPADIVLTPHGAWKSPQSGVRYPAQWTMKLAEGELTITPLRIESEFNGLETTFNQYWEGAVRVSGALSGSGFLEMSGYDQIKAVQAAE